HALHPEPGAFQDELGGVLTLPDHVGHVGPGTGDVTRFGRWHRHYRQSLVQWSHRVEPGPGRHLAAEDVAFTAQPGWVGITDRCGARSVRPHQHRAGVLRCRAEEPGGTVVLRRAGLAE